MNLKQINERLDLFPKYLRYRLDNWQSLPFGKIYTLRTEGVVYLNEVKSFDRWLYDNGYEALVLTERGKFVYDGDGAIVFKNDPTGVWYLGYPPCIMKDIVLPKGFTAGIDPYYKSDDK